MERDALRELLKKLIAFTGDGEPGEFSAGDRIKVELQADILRELQEDHGGYNPEMEKIINVPGTVEVHARGNIYLVLFDNGLYFCMNSAAFVRLPNETREKTIKVGEIVKFDADVENMRRLQENYGGFNEKMVLLAGKHGYVTSRSAVQFCVLSGPFKFVWNPHLLTHVTPQELDQLSSESESSTRRSIGRFDIVQISSNADDVKRHQTDHGEWVSAMQYIVGKYGFVKRVLPGGDLYLRVHGRSWRVNPASCKLVIPCELIGVEQEGGRKEKGPQEDPLPIIGSLVASLNSDENIFQAAAKGDLETLKRLEKLGADFDFRLDGYDVIHVAASCRENVEVLKYLVQKDRDKLKVEDQNGNTALHLAAACAQESNIVCLLSLGASPKAQDKMGQSPLHKAVWKGSLPCVEQLIKRGGAINMKDTECGHTPLHDAITYKCSAIGKVLIQRGASFIIENSSGFNTVFWAALKGEREIFLSILESEGVTKERIYNARMKEGFSIFHVLSINNYTDIFQDVMNHFPDIKLDIFDASNSMTPLHLASGKLLKEMVELLLIHGANPNVIDKDGDTPMHLCIMASKSKHRLEGADEMEKLLKGIKKFANEELVKDICFLLIAAGADMHQKNFSGKSPLELCQDIELPTFLVEKFTSLNVTLKPSLSRADVPSPPEPPSVSLPPPPHKKGEFSSFSSIPFEPKREQCDSFGTRPSSSSYSGSSSSTQKPKPQTYTSDRKSTNMITNIGRAQTRISCETNMGNSTLNTSSSTTNDECQICVIARVDTYLPCGHLLCRQCSKRLYCCPFCRGPYDLDELSEIPF